jgi:2-polyprenyl-3-methyl-5-hydroxy-6-metoxy-1,4-benzoquinol methylase
MADTPATPDAEKLKQKQALLSGIAAHAYVAAMVSLGLRLGLYGAMAQRGPVTSDDLARETGLHERWLREWLREQAAAHIVEYDGGGRFELSPEAAALLAQEDSLLFLGASFIPLPHRISVVERLPEAFRTGIGLSWDERGEESAPATELMFRNWYRLVLVPVALPALAGVVPRLEAGARVADVGCGTGIALLEMARAFPRSEFHGYDISEHAIERARASCEAAGLTNAHFHQAKTDPLPADGSFDLITTFDCLHDMTDPASVAAAIRAALRADGTWFIADIDGKPTFEENLRDNPLAQMLYAMSVLSCMSSALSEPGGAGLGTLGLPEPAMRELAAGAGFSQFRRVDLRHPVNAFYEARP